MELIALRLGEMQIALAPAGTTSPTFAPEPITAQDTSTWIRQVRCAAPNGSRRGSRPGTTACRRATKPWSRPSAREHPGPRDGGCASSFRTRARAANIRHHHGDFPPGPGCSSSRTTSASSIFEGEPRRSVADRPQEGAGRARRRRPAALDRLFPPPRRFERALKSRARRARQDRTRPRHLARTLEPRPSWTPTARPSPII